MVRIDKIPQRFACIFDDLIDYTLKSSAQVENGLPVVITGAPRSATTTLEELFNSHKVYLYHEPFIKNTILWNNKLAAENHPDAFDISAVKATISKIQEGRDWLHYRKHNRWYPYITKFALHKTLALTNRRPIIKDPGISFCLDEIAPLIGPHNGIILMRNPLSIVTSLSKLKWDPINRLRVIYSHPYFKRYDIHKGGLSLEKIELLTPLERMALQTSLLHYFLSVQAPLNPNYQIVYFETLMSNIKVEINNLADSLSFSKGYIQPKTIADITANDASPSSKHSYKRNSQRYAKYWENITNAEDCNTINYYYTLFNKPYPL